MSSSVTLLLPASGSAEQANREPEMTSNHQIHHWSLLLTMVIVATLQEVLHLVTTVTVMATHDHKSQQSKLLLISSHALLLSMKRIEYQHACSD